MKKCEKCGMTGRDDMTFCVNCGGNMVEASAESETGEASVTPMDGVTNDTVSASVEPTISATGTTVTEPVVKKPKAKMNKNTVLLIGIIAAVLVGIGGIIFGIVMANSRGNNNGGGQNSSTPTVITVTKTEVPVGKWVFEIPDGIEYSVEGGNSLTFGEANSWMAITKYDDTATYSKIKSNIQIYAKEIAKQLSMEVYETGTTEVGDDEFTWVDFIVRSDTGEKGYCTVVFSEASDMYSFMTFYVTNEFELDHDRFEDIAEVVGSATKKTDSKVIIDEEVKIDISKPVDLTVVEL